MSTASSAIVFVCLFLLPPAARDSQGTPKTVRARVTVKPWGPQVRHRVHVTNAAKEGRIIAVVVGQSPGVTERLVTADLAEGWRHKMVKVQAPERWAIFLTCDPDEWEPTAAGGGVASPSSREEHLAAYSVKPGGAVQFDLFLSYRSASVEQGPVAVAFADWTIVQAQR